MTGRLARSVAIGGTSWGRDRLSPVLVEEVQRTAPDGTTVTFGFGKRWCCRIYTDPRRPAVAEGFDPSSRLLAFRQAMAQLEEDAA